MKILKNSSEALARSWLWLFPLTYLIHIAEEYWGGEGYSAHLLKTRGVYMSGPRFLVVQTIGTVLMVVGVVLARRFKFPNGMVIIMATIVLVNALTHIVNSLRTLSYEPGLLSSIIIWLPLGVFTLVHFRQYVMNEKRYWISIGIGVGVNVVIAVITMRGGRLF